MSIKIGSISAKNIYIGSTPAKEIRLGSILIWSREPEEVYYTLTLNGLDSGGIEDYSIYINEVPQPKYTTYQILKGSFVQVSISVDTINYNYDFTSNIGGESDAGDGWTMNKDVIITVSTTPIPSTYYTLTINYDDGLDYVAIYYKQPGEESFTYVDKIFDIELQDGTLFYIVPYFLDGYESGPYTDELGSESNPLALTGDKTLYINCINQELEEYNITVRTTHNGQLEAVDGITIKANGSVIGSSMNSEYISVAHNGTDPITVEFDTLKSIYSFEWTGSIQPTEDYFNRIYSWDNLPEDGTLTVDFSN